MEKKTSVLAIVLIGLAVVGLIVMGTLLLKHRPDQNQPLTSSGDSSTPSVSTLPSTSPGSSPTATTAKKSPNPTVKPNVATRQPSSSAGSAVSATTGAGLTAYSPASPSQAVRAAFENGQIMKLDKIPATSAMSRAVRMADELNLTDEQRTKLHKLNTEFAARLQIAFDKLGNEMDAAWTELEKAHGSGDQTALKAAEENYANLTLRRKTMALEVERSYLDSTTKYLSSKQYVQLARKLGVPVEGMGEGFDFPPGYKLPD